jgi:mannose-6-phosphate isomerase-like protein (cupin superfamily)
MRYIVAMLALAAVAAAPDGVQVWKAAEFPAMGKTLGAKLNPLKFANTQIGNYGNHSLLVTHRQGSGESEIHETQADIFIVQEGAATLVFGGTIVSPRNTGPGEIRGSAITGGQKRPLAPGDVAHIPAKTPHQVLLEPGAKFTYTIVKVDTR